MSILKFLRHNSRHTLWFPRGSRYGEGWPVRLNPIASSSHNEKKQRTWYFHETLWMFRLRQRLFCARGRQRCGRRGDWDQLAVSKAFGGDKPLPDTWDIGPDGNRTCSYCGSIHPDDLMAICRKVPDDECYGIEGTTKSYKVYVRQPGVRNAGEGAIKFYMHHAPATPSKEDEEAFALAVKLTRERRMRQFQHAV